MAVVEEREVEEALVRGKSVERAAGESLEGGEHEERAAEEAVAETCSPAGAPPGTWSPLSGATASETATTTATVIWRCKARMRAPLHVVQMRLQGPASNHWGDAVCGLRACGCQDLLPPDHR